MKKTLCQTLFIVVSITFTHYTVANNGIKYNYLEGRFVIDAELDEAEANVDGDGFGFGGSYRLDERMYLMGDYESLDYDDDADSDLLQIGAGFILPYEKVDFIAELALVDSDFDGGSSDSSDTGFRATVGARGYIIPYLELRGTVNYIDTDDGDSFLTIAADYFISQSLSVGLAKDLSADVDRLSLGLRYYFGE